MSASPEILELLHSIVDKQCSSRDLARWLAENSLRFLERVGETDRIIVTDLDAALGEIQRGTKDDTFLLETVNELATGLHLNLWERQIVLDFTDSNIRQVTSSSNTGGVSTTVGELIPSSS